ncbi:MAG: GNAT family N-acetyltransferase [Oscillospiraceae bacterium]|nr:GNAT family N-acetyltransferase [Oscillospiraceae bacterium]
MLTQAAYLADPCGISSLPWWKAVTVRVPEGIQILHARDLPPGAQTIPGAIRYFRLMHPMDDLTEPVVPTGFLAAVLTPEAAAEHIRACYSDISVSASELAAYQRRPVYDGSLWLALLDSADGKIAASGIGELDRNLREGVLEWIEVSPAYRGKGLGSFLVRELLWRMRGKADFVTVSGKLDDPCAPDRLYRRCGFTGEDVWYFIRQSDRHPSQR